MVTKLMSGKKGVIMGVANDKSIASSIAKTLYENGAEICFTYPNDILKSRVQNIANKFNSNLLLECDVSKDDNIEKTFNIIKEKWGKIDFLVHSIGYSDKNELRGRSVDTSRNNFSNTMLISCYSFIEASKHASNLMKEGGSIITLTYYGAEKVLPNYNIMGVAKAALETSVKYIANDLGPNNIRVNAISAGPIKTLAATGIGDFNYILKWNERNAPLRRTVTQEDVAKSALYLLSDLGSGVTGEIHYVDSGYNIIGMKAVDAEDIVKN